MIVASLVARPGTWAWGPYDSDTAGKRTQSPAQMTQSRRAGRCYHEHCVDPAPRRVCSAGPARWQCVRPLPRGMHLRCSRHARCAGLSSRRSSHIGCGDARRRVLKSVRSRSPRRREPCRTATRGWRTGTCPRLARRGSALRPSRGGGVIRSDSRAERSASPRPRLRFRPAPTQAVSPSFPQLR